MTACSTWPPSDHRIDAIRAAAAEPLDWNYFERIVTRHRVVGLAYEGLRTAGVQVPALTVEDLGNRAAASVRAGLVSAAEAARLQSLFDKARAACLVRQGGFPCNVSVWQPWFTIEQRSRSFCPS